jgi:dTDP-4-dehydrorhamnose reductase
MRKVLITGGTGQLGIELLRQAWPDDVEVIAPGRDEMDLHRQQSIGALIGGGPWSCVINSAAFTAVDAAEEDPGNAFMANCQGPAWLAEATAKADIPLIHVSTDYVFRGDGIQPYAEDDPVDPVSVYGASKAAGELAVRTINPRSVVLRTAWVLSAHRSNFLKTMLRVAASRDSLGVVADQRGCPTAAPDLAEALMTIALRLMEDSAAPTGTYHFVNSGDATWHELALEIFRLSGNHGGPTAEVRPITTAEFPTKARRPANSQLTTTKIGRDFGVRPRDWRSAVADIITELNRDNSLKESTQ